MTAIAFSMIHATTIPERVALYHDHVAPAWAQQGIHYALHLDPPQPHMHRVGIWGNAKLAWSLLIDSGASHGCMLADDLIPCPGLENKLISIVNKNQHAAVNFFQPACADIEAVEQLMEKGVPFEIPEQMTTWGGCLVLPTGRIREVLQVADRFDGFGDMDDVRLTHALRDLSIPIVNVGRALVRHLGALHASFSGPQTDDSRVTRFRLGINFDVS